MGRTLSEREQRHKTQRFIAGTEVLSKVITSGFKWGALVWIAYYAYRSIDSLSGRTTLAQVAIKLLGSVSINKWLCVMLAGGTSVWALGERSLRRRKVGELGERLKKYETKIDNGRSSSTLPPSGKTRKDDII